MEDHTDNYISIAGDVTTINSGLIKINDEILRLAGNCGQPIRDLLIEISINLATKSGEMLEKVTKKLLEHAKAGLY